MTYSDSNLALVGAIRSYLGSRTIQRPVSIDRMLRTARRAVPDLVVSDDELAELIARELIHEGADVDFDHMARKHAPEPERFDTGRPWKSASSTAANEAGRMPTVLQPSRRTSS